MISTPTQPPASTPIGDNGNYSVLGRTYFLFFNSLCVALKSISTGLDALSSALDAVKARVTTLEADFNSIKDAVLGGSVMVTVGNVPIVASRRTLGPSAITDDGTTVTVTEPVNTTAIYQVAGQQVVGPRLAAISAPTISTSNTAATAGATYTSNEQGMLNALKTAVAQANADIVNLQATVNSLRDAMRVGTGHGLTS